VFICSDVRAVAGHVEAEKTGLHVRMDEHGDHASRGVTRSRSLPPE
jgi:hypothetical protein